MCSLLYLYFVAMFVTVLSMVCMCVHVHDISVCVMFYKLSSPVL